jgi:hypothetical protein
VTHRSRVAAPRRLRQQPQIIERRLIPPVRDFILRTAIGEIETGRGSAARQSAQGIDAAGAPLQAGAVPPTAPFRR